MSFATLTGHKKDDLTSHIDYVFLPSQWLSQLQEFSVGTFEDWCTSSSSDHVPTVVDLELHLNCDFTPVGLE